MSNLLTVNETLLTSLLEDARKFVFSRESEESLKELVACQETISEAIDELKTNLKEAALERDSSTRSIEGDLIKVTFSAAGARYKLINVKQVPPEVLQITLSPALVDNYVEKNHKIPEGVVEVERGLSCKISFKKGAPTE